MSQPARREPDVVGALEERRAASTRIRARCGPSRRAGWPASPRPDSTHSPAGQGLFAQACRARAGVGVVRGVAASCRRGARTRRAMASRQGLLRDGVGARSRRSGAARSNRVMARSKLCQKTWTGLVLPQNQPSELVEHGVGPFEDHGRSARRHHGPTRRARSPRGTVCHRDAGRLLPDLDVKAEIAPAMVEAGDGTRRPTSPLSSAKPRCGRRRFDDQARGRRNQT